MASNKRCLGSRHAGSRQLYTEDGVSHGISSSSPLPHRKLTGTSCTHWHIAHRGNRDGVSRHFAIQTQQVYQAGGSTNAYAKSLIPATFAKPRGHLHPDKNLICDHSGREEFLTRCLNLRRYCKQRAQTIARVASGVRVIEIKVADHAGVYERRRIGCHDLRGCQNPSGHLLTRSAASERQPDLCGIAVVCIYGAPYRIKEALLACFNCVGRKIIERQLSGELSEAL